MFTAFAEANIVVKGLVVAAAVYILLSVFDLASPDTLPPWMSSWLLTGLWARFSGDMATVAVPVGGGGSHRHRHRHRAPAGRRSDNGPHPL